LLEQILLIIVAIGVILLVLYQLMKVSGVLFLTRLISGLVFIYVYRNYLFFQKAISIQRI